LVKDLNPSVREEREKNTLLITVVRAVTDRYFVLSAIFCSVGVVILCMTSALQFSGYQRTISSTTTGVQRMYTVSAPRGDILDCNGVPLATSESVNTVLIANAGLLDDDLNSMCLELSYLFDEYNCLSESDLDEYFSIDPFEFHKDEEEIRLWQTNHNLFDLQDYSEGIIVTFTDDYVKTDPQVFFLYMRNLFGIDEDYTEEEAYRICRIRYQIFQDNWSFQMGTPVEIATDVPDELVTKIVEQNYHYMGLICTQTYRRVYTPMAQLSCHVVGYVGRISQESLATLQPFGYSNDDLVGQSGVESQMERYLHGQSGISSYNIWTTDGLDGQFFPSTYGVPAQAGATVNLTIDSDLQMVGIEALKQYIADAEYAEMIDPKGYRTANAGAFVMMDVNTGAVLAMGSYPNFDPNDFVLSMYGDTQAQEQLEYYLGIGEYEDITAEDMPLWNRAIMSQYAPGSTFKMCTALAALEAGKITPYDSWWRCESPIDIDGWTFRCLEFSEGGHGPLDLNGAMATSCNIYFMRIGVETGIDNIDAMGERLGLGEYTGIDLPGEFRGVRASRETKRLLHESEYDRTWFPADTAQSAIGQFDNCFTILQLCRYTAGIATNRLVTPYVVDSVIASDGTVLYTGQQVPTPLGISEENIEAVRFAMRCVVTGTSQWQDEATARDTFMGFPVSVACKTGTAETGFEDIRKEYSNGLFVCYAPAEDPQVAIALVVERGEWGSSTAVIARQLLAAYFGIPEDNSNVVDYSPSNGDVVPSVDALPAEYEDYSDYVYDEG
jgi:penicillin-binding protein 2